MVSLGLTALLIHINIPQLQGSQTVSFVRQCTQSMRGPFFFTLFSLSPSHYPSSPHPDLRPYLSIYLQFCFSLHLSCPSLQVIEASKSAQLHDVITRFPLCYATKLNSNGQRVLSTTQRLHLSLARLLLASPKIVFADNWTGRISLQKAKHFMTLLFNRLLPGCTVVAAINEEQIELAQLFNRIIVLSRGRLQEIGCHDDLISSSFHYRRLCRVAPNDLAMDHEGKGDLSLSPIDTEADSETCLSKGTRATSAVSLASGKTEAVHVVQNAEKGTVTPRSNESNLLVESCLGQPKLCTRGSQLEPFLSDGSPVHQSTAASCSSQPMPAL